jgi:hypothetical protein
VSDSTAFEKVDEQSKWYGARARHNRAWYTALKTTQMVVAAAIPVVSVAASGNPQRWTSAILGALIGVLEGVIQLGQYQQNWWLYRATREALKREEFLHSAKAGAYSDVPDPDKLYVERSDAIISGENTKWIASQEQSDSKKGARPRQG